MASLSYNDARIGKVMYRQRRRKPTNNGLFSSIERPNLIIPNSKFIIFMKSRTKIELSRAAGVSPETFRRWLKTDRAFLEANGIRPTTKLFPPQVVKYLCDKYAIDL